ncbi:holo-[acyl-carrier-protein] synthase [Candidatus Kaiserbacteria bacterium RIFCSPHIGHO2_12_FULL_53_13]|uniref:Holo-[acyl-carrier-protein] synthase n=1 Tax=Candidatus Kaiserbacteria bacterium RIFCSPHIGHO2_12_FULL_53_13 TaxID=1798502 RepID=A0A1F6EBU4_9BACT|nr:MAG: holo-[acyl-carrier-protein] synthase [Candidatus Kaiserbacteria bacterium RIFCSPHIGHO2_12_FULL_53_13]OGG74694.1 MAG: holo-[acyl-carrier-protein] synthase [Candidatus Kaiserbacteria bacterium RIFCSPLOWO2_01_FULL_52_36]
MKNARGFGVGVDIEDIGRFAELRRVKDKLFLQKIFTSRELDYCFSKNDPAPHLAARFCAKEAIVKALHSLGESDMSYADIEIIKLSRGAPYVRFVREQNDLHVSISLSHTKDIALASALAIRI